MSTMHRITEPADLALQPLCAALCDAATQLESPQAWPATQLQLCAESGVFEWFLDRSVGGQGWDDEAVTRGYLALSAACLTTTFVITQRTGACQRIANSGNAAVIERWLPRLLSGEVFATVGISHLTTSRRHLAQPVLKAEERPGGYVLDGYSPWVTGAPFADVVVLGATLDDGRQLLIALPMELDGVTTPEPPALVGLSASQTGPVKLDQVFVLDENVLAGPVHEVMKQGVGGNTGGRQTSTLAIGVADAAIAFVEQEAGQRADLGDPASSLRAEWAELRDDLLQLTRGTDVCSNEQLRTRANSLALRASQASLAAAKGAGYVIGHPAARWCREALFFLVWSCPQPVMNANLCELAGIQADLA